jgi:hypothetical protein
MFCPQCKAEYRSGFARCSDCDVDLVDHLTAPDATISASEAQMKRVWSSDERESCTYVCAGLRAAGIPFKVSERKRQFLWSVDENYEVLVPPESYDKAKEIAQQGVFDFSDSADDQKIMELPDAGPSSVVNHYDLSRSFRSEDATVEVWSEKTEERAWFEGVKGLAWMIELSLAENSICARVNVSGGLRQIFVKPQDELQAREIVREIKSGTPPT